MKLKEIGRIRNYNSEEFTSKFMKPNIPVIIEDFIDAESPALKNWNYDYFKEIAGNNEVDVYGEEIHSLDRAASKPLARMKFSEYLDLISREKTKYRLFLFNLLTIKPELKKDVIYKDITKGKVLSWLPFMFFGGQGSNTRNHVDIDMSHVFLTQYQGIKKVWLFPLSQSDLIYKLPYNFHSIANLKTSSQKEFPGLKYLDGYEAVLKPGQTLYMPSGWWHFIQYETEGYSISVRALPFQLIEKWRGFKNLVITQHFDNLMRKLFKEQWFDYKVSVAKKRAQNAIDRIEGRHVLEDIPDIPIHF
ncbi:cupin-like domain-containing protein [Epilithonimonas sp. JDS]|uniref:cupin-like domain-containing protein n=1 Tax=Epilithonimonas sp. JDS TaxID=2902797 RepID=UPI001E59F43E|nr:cupin-like domain-containing protein [Epilithonimonas sp. JDS]MCD9856029.1 cupin-like domain-containing protein [Epilithonimonas sp. JDS]